MRSGTRSDQPDSARGMTGMIVPIPTEVSAKPTRTMLAGRRFPDFLPASSATPNMLSDRGASDSPAFIASYSSVICKNSGSAIIAPPRVICCIIV